jgi:hypothetical protein
MNQDSVKELLLKIENTELDFSVVFTGKKSKKVNGLYKPDSREILLHNRNFDSDNQLIYTAIHEYAHHLTNETQGGTHSGRVHNTDFWARFHTLLEKAEAEGIYSIGVDTSPELSKLTEELRSEYLEGNGRAMQQFGRLLVKAQQLCLEAGIRYEDYIDRVLKIPRSSAKAVIKVSSVEVNPAVGYDNMKMLAGISSAEKRAAAEQQLTSGHSPDMVKVSSRRNPDPEDPKERLEKEKRRLEKTISMLTSRLEQVERSLEEI